MLDAFHNETFPLRIALGSRGGPSRRTDIVSLASGHERRTARWSRSRRRYQVGCGVQTKYDLAAILAFFEGRQGRRYAYRFRDPFDHCSAGPEVAPTPTDQPLGTGDGSQTDFQLIKRYGGAGYAQDRAVYLPIAQSVMVAKDGNPLSQGTDVTIDAIGGVVRFPVAPAPGAVLTAGFLFDVPVRFDTDTLVLSAEPGGTDVPDIPLTEVFA